MQDVDSPRSIDETQELSPPEISSMPKGFSKRKAPSPCEFTHPGKAVKSGKGKSDISLAVDTMLIKTLQNMENNEGSVDKKEETDGDSLFSQSLVPILRGLPPKKNRYAKMKIQKLLYDIEFDEEM